MLLPSLPFERAKNSLSGAQFRSPLRRARVYARATNKLSVTSGLLRNARTATRPLFHALILAELFIFIILAGSFFARCRLLQFKRLQIESGPKEKAKDGKLQAKSRDIPASRLILEGGALLPVVISRTQYAATCLTTAVEQRRYPCGLPAFEYLARVSSPARYRLPCVVNMILPRGFASVAGPRR